MRTGLEDDPGRISYVELGDRAGATAAVPAQLLRSVTIEGAGAGATPITEIVAELPRYLGLIAAGTVHALVRTYPLHDVATA